MIDYFHSNGKLLFTGEYVVLDGALSLAIPTKYGQTLEIISSKKEGIEWISLDDNGNSWFDAHFSLKEFKPTNVVNSISKTLSNILKEAQNLNPTFLGDIKGVQVKTKLDFPRKWGLGTSSTLINNIAQWAEVDAFTLLEKSFGGSGYDIAAAQHNLPILYQRRKAKPIIEEISLKWNFTDSIFFVHLNQKKDSKEGIAHYKNITVSRNIVQEISEISVQLWKITSLSDFEQLLNRHEQLISETLKLSTIKEELFRDYPKTIKSLGAWGGDFVMATGNFSDREYFKNKGFETIVPFNEMIL